MSTQLYPRAMAKPDIYLHLGAHRTGSSSFQMALHLNAPVLSEAGFALAYPGRDGVPGGELRLKLPHLTDDDIARNQRVLRVGRKLKRHLGEQPRLLISDENILGSMLEFWTGQFFHERALRLQTLASALPGPVRGALLVIRPVNELFVSAYRIWASDTLVRSFAHYRPHLLQAEARWRPVVEDILATLRPERLTVVDFRARGPSTSLIAALLPDLRDRALAEPTGRVNESLDDKTLRARQAELAERKGRPLPATEDGAFAAFDADEILAFREAYAEDLDEIGSLPGVELRRA